MRAGIETLLELVFMTWTPKNIIGASFEASTGVGLKLRCSNAVAAGSSGQQRAGKVVAEPAGICNSTQKVCPLSADSFLA